MRVQVEKLDQLTIAPMSQLERFPSGIQPALLLVEQAVDAGSLQFVRGDLQSGRICKDGYGLEAACQ